jgi:valine--pyruvate aminotransferase
MSLSKFGLPAARTGVVVAAPEIVRALARMTAIVNLAPGGIGAALLREFVETGEMIRISREVIRPFYQERAERAKNCVHQHFGGKVEYRIHKCEGSMFLWLWFPSLGITTYELYERLKARGVIVVPGRYFFPGLQEDWGHTEECIRINYAHAPCMVEEGLKVIADEAAKW